MTIKFGKFHYKIERRKNTGIIQDILSIVIALLTSIIILSGIIVYAGSDIITVLRSIFRGAFGSLPAIIDTLIQSTPIIFTGLATVIAFRAKVWNIGQEGQLYAGAMAATFIVLTFPEMPKVIYIPLLLIVSIIGGALWAFIPGILKAKYKVNEIIVTVMLNYVIIFIASYLLNSSWQDPGVYYYISPRFPDSTMLPRLFGTHLHLGFVLAIIFTVIVTFLLWKTPLGYEIRATGHNPTASRYKGININSIVMIVLVLSGAISGLAGGVEIFGIHQRLIFGFSTDFGFTGIMIALLGRLHPIGVVIASIFFGALYNGSAAMQIYAGVPRELVNLTIGLVILMLLLWEAIFKYQVRRIQIDG